jgi:hypothetical protein
MKPHGDECSVVADKTRFFFGSRVLAESRVNVFSLSVRWLRYATQSKVATVRMSHCYPQHPTVWFRFVAKLLPRRPTFNQKVRKRGGIFIGDCLKKLN